MKILILLILIFFGTAAWACCMAAATSDEHAEELYRDYLEYKRSKEKEDPLQMTWDDYEKQETK